MIHAFAAMEAKGELQPFEYDPGELKAGDVEIEVLYCGVCHSDLSMVDNEWGFTRYPLVPGHEVVGKVVAMGEHVSGFNIGDAVGLGWHSGYCEHCAMCHSGDENLCSQAQPTIIGHHGGFADKVRASAASIVKIPGGVDLATAGPLFCAGITVFNPLLELGIKPTDKVAVIGIGGLGHLALQFLNAWGCEVTAFTSSDDKRQEALALGAHHTLNSRDKAEIKSAQGRFDFIISTVNVKLDWNGYIATLAPRGRLHFVGAVAAPLDISVFGLMVAQRAISSSTVGSPSSMVKMLDFVRVHGIKPQVEEFAFADINQAMDRLRNGQPHYRVVLKR